MAHVGHISANAETVESRGDRPQAFWRAPALATLLSHPGMARWTSLALILQLAAGIWHTPGMPCPALQLGVPCPGCGATRACVFLLEGHWHEALTLHLFAPVFIAAVAMFFTAALLPRSWQKKFAAAVAFVEFKAGVTALLLIAILLYWLVRLVYDFEGFRQLVAT